MLYCSASTYVEGLTSSHDEFLCPVCGFPAGYKEISTAFCYSVAWRVQIRCLLFYPTPSSQCLGATSAVWWWEEGRISKLSALPRTSWPWHRPTVLHVWGLVTPSVSYKITGLLKSLSCQDTHGSGGERSCLPATLTWCQLFCSKSGNKRVWEVQRKNYQHPISSQEGCGSVETVLTPTPTYVRGFREQGDCKILPLSVHLLFRCKFSI